MNMTYKKTTICGENRAAQYLGISVPTLRKWMREGRLPYVKLSPRKYYFQVKDLDKLMWR